MADDRTDRMRLRVSRTLFVHHLMSHQASGGVCSDGTLSGRGEAMAEGTGYGVIRLFWLGQ
jgi:hypothetical protein